MDNIHRLWEKLEFDPNEIHNMNNRRAIAAFSGGFDSTAALWWAMDHYNDLTLIILDYNQFHREELLCAHRIASLTGVRTRTIKLDIPSDFWGISHHLTRGQAGLMTAVAALDLSPEGADIIHGILRTDGFPDCDRNYLDTLAGILGNGMDTGAIGIATPLRAVKDKQAVCVLGFLYGAPIRYTWSCRTPLHGRPCGNCAACRARSGIWESMEAQYCISRKEMDEWQDVLGSPAHPVFREPPEKLSILVQAFIEMEGLNYAGPGWRYRGPDGKLRFAAWIRNPDAIRFPGRSSGEICSHVEIHGDLEDGSRWQLVICGDHKVAFTDRMPDIDIVESMLKAKLVQLIFGDR